MSVVRVLKKTAHSEGALTDDLYTREDRRMDKERIIILCTVVSLVSGGAIALLNGGTVSIASVIEADGNRGAPGIRTASVVSGRYLKVPVGSILLEPPEDITGKRSPVDFPHSRHFVYKCQRCHHKWLGDAELRTCSSAKCHDQVTRPERPGRSIPDPDYDIAYFREAYHQQCISCHRELQQQNLEFQQSLTKANPLTDWLQHLFRDDAAYRAENKPPVGGPTTCGKCHLED